MAQHRMAWGWHSPGLGLEQQGTGWEQPHSLGDSPSLSHSWHDPARSLWPGTAWHSLSLPSRAWHSLARYSPALLYVVAWQSLAWPSLARHSMYPHPGGQEGAQSKAGGYQGTRCAPEPAMTAAVGQRGPGAGTLWSLPSSGRQQKPHKGTLSAGTRELCVRPLVPPGSTAPGSPAPSCGCWCPSGTALFRLTGALFAAAGDTSCRGWAQEPGIGKSHPGSPKCHQPQPQSSHSRLAHLRAEYQRRDVNLAKEKKKKTPNLQNPKSSLLLTLCFSPGLGRAAPLGHAVRPGQGLASARQACRQERGIFWLFSLSLLVKVRHAASPRARPCLGTGTHRAPSRRGNAGRVVPRRAPRLPPSWRRAPAGCRGSGQPGGATEPRIRHGTAWVADAGVAAGGAGGAGTRR